MGRRNTENLTYDSGGSVRGGGHLWDKIREGKMDTEEW